MVKVIHVDGNGAEMAVIELDDITIEILYAGIANMLRDAALSTADRAAAPELSKAARLRREKILTRLQV